MPTSYHFDLGNSSSGQLGLCARVLADSPQQAAERLQQAFEHFGNSDGIKVGYDDCVDPAPPPVTGLEYIRLYLNPNADYADCIDDEEERHIGIVHYSFPCDRRVDSTSRIWLSSLPLEEDACVTEYDSHQRSRPAFIEWLA